MALSRVFPRRFVSTSPTWLEQKGQSKRHALVNECPKSLRTVKNQDKAKIPPGIRQPHVVIIGAGMAGLSAAQRLVSCGLSNITILEAIDRPGGRVCSCNAHNNVIDLGASEIEGASLANPIYTLACSTGLPDLFLPKNYCKSCHFYNPRGGPLEAPSKVFDIVQHAQEKAMSLFALKPPLQPKCLEEVLWEGIKEGMNSVPDHNANDYIAMIRGLLQNLRYRWGDDLRYLSAENYGSFIKIPGGTLKLKSGFRSLILALLKDIPEKKIIYKKVVQTIQWSSYASTEPKLTIRCCDGEDIHADFVILTVSLGVLKSQVDRLFCPPLPIEKIEAIKNLGYGFSDKILLYFEEPFWMPYMGTMRIARYQEDLLDKNHWIQGIAKVKDVARNVLMVTVGGREAVWMLQTPLNVVVEELIEYLRKLTNNPGLPYPCNAIRSVWSTNLFFMGSRSYMGETSTIKHQCDLAAPLPGLDEPFPPTLLFAGEATCPGHFSTLQGARISGIREADRIIDVVLSMHGSPHKVSPCEIKKDTCSKMNAIMSH